MALDAVLFDLDGTLIDSNQLHIEAWSTAFERFGYRIPADRIRQEIGKGGDRLVPAILGPNTGESLAEPIAEAHSKDYAARVRQVGLRVFPGVPDLLAALRERGLKRVLATSSKRKELTVAEAGSGLNLDSMFDQITHADDARQSKPAPDIVAAAVAGMKLSPAQCAMIGDTPYDAESARGAGVVCLGLTCGRCFNGGSLLSAGMRGTWRDPADLLANLDDALALASPGAAHLTQQRLEDLMREALSSAREGLAAGEAPIGAAIATGDGTVIAHGFNELNRSANPTSHAEMVVFGRMAGKVPSEARDLILISTLEPCVMCLGAAMEAAVDTIIFGLEAPADSGTGRVSPPRTPESQMPRIIGRVLAAESRKLFERWLAREGNKPEQQVKFVRQLLSLTSH